MNKRVLVVDDDQYIRELYEEVLKDAGFTVEAASDGQAGLVLLQKGGYDLVLLDVMMPKLDGIGVLKALRTTPAVQQNGPIILLTNLDHDPMLQEALNLGAKSYLIKANMNPDQLLQNLQKFLTPETAPTTPQPPPADPISTQTSPASPQEPQKLPN